MQTWIVSILILSRISIARADGAPGFIQSDLNPPVKVALYKYDDGLEPVTKKWISSMELRCQEFRYLKGICERVNSFIESQEIE